MEAVDDVQETLAEYQGFARRADRAHYQMALKLEHRARLLGIPVIVTTSIVGTTIFATLQDATAVGWRIATGLLSVAAAMLASLQTFLNYNGAAQRHEASADGHARLWRQAEMFRLRLNTGDMARAAALDELLVMTKEMDELEKQAPRITNRIWERQKQNQQGPSRAGGANGRA